MLKLTLVRTRAASRDTIRGTFINVFTDSANFFSGKDRYGLIHWKASVLDGISFFHIKLFSQARQCYYTIPYIY